MGAQGRTVTRYQLINSSAVYDFDGFDRTVDTHVSNLRRKPKSSPGAIQYIKTVYGIGYRFEPAYSHSRAPVQVNAGVRNDTGLTLAGVSSHSAYATRQETVKFAEEVEFARSSRAERLVDDAYWRDQDWERVQYAVQQVGAIFGWRVVIADQLGNIVADSHYVIRPAPKHLDEDTVFVGKYVKRPL